MDHLMRMLAPRGWIGFLVRLVVLILVVAATNNVFARYFDRLGTYEIHSAVYYLAHATFVGGPLIAFFLAVSAFQIRLQRRLYRLSRKDGLTGLNNRRSFFELVSKLRTIEHKGVLLMLDADHFKKINDTHGHQAGDKCLKSIAYVLRRSIREHDVLGRLGGEEFAIYLNNVSAETARIIGERLTRPISFKIENDASLSVTLSVGAVPSEPALSIDALLARADEALYHAKLTGRARIVMWDAVLAHEQGDQAAIPVLMSR